MPILATEPSSTTTSTGSSSTCEVPTGMTHALDDHASRTRCGFDATRLVRWPDHAWPPPGMAGVDTCPACDAAAPLGSFHG